MTFRPPPHPPHFFRSVENDPSPDYSPIPAFWLGAVLYQTRSASEGKWLRGPRLRFGLVWTGEYSGLAPADGKLDPAQRQDQD